MTAKPATPESVHVRLNERTGRPHRLQRDLPDIGSAVYGPVPVRRVLAAAARSCLWLALLLEDLAGSWVYELTVNRPQARPSFGLVP